MNKTMLMWSALLLSGNLGARMVTVSSTEDYNKHYQSETPMVTMYSAEWCGPCKQMKPHYYSAAEATSDVTFCVVDTGAKAFEGIASGIMSIPTVIFRHKGKPVRRENGGMSRKQLDSHISEFRKTVQPAPAVQPVAVTQTAAVKAPVAQPNAAPAKPVEQKLSTTAVTPKK